MTVSHVDSASSRPATSQHLRGLRARVASLALAAVAALAAASSACAAAQVRGSPERPRSPACVPAGMAIERYTLENGLTVVLSADRSTSAVAVAVDYAVGAREDPRELPGLAHFFEHLMFEGTDALSAPDRERELDRAGLSVKNGTTHLDSTVYYEQLAPRGLAFALWMEADRMATVGRSLTAEKLERVRAVVVHERLERVENALGSTGWVELQSALYPASHPYAHAYSDTPEKLGAVELADARAFFDTHYTPDVATLIVTGNFDAAEAKEWIASYFGPIPRGHASIASPSTLPAPRLRASKRIVVEANVLDPVTTLGWNTPSLRAEGDVELDGLLALSDELASELREQGLARSVSIRHPSHALGSELVISVTSAPHTPAAAVERAVLRALAQLGGKAHEAALRRWSQQSSRQRLETLETPVGRALLIAGGVDAETDPWAFAASCEAQRALTIDQVRTAVLRHVSGRPHVVVSVIPNGQRSTAGSAVSWEDE